jgi:threonine synthase
VTFEEVVMGGLAPDKGLYVPQELPYIPPEQLEKLRDASFVELANYIMRLVVGPEDIPPENLRVLIECSTKNFRVHEVAPVRKVGPTWVLELFHGPTFAFKDVALQFLGNVFEFFMAKKKDPDVKLTVLGATSGDTGSAAIEGLRGKKNVNVFVLYPKGRVSEVQERQMTTVLDKNVHCIAVENATFDDCQSIVKSAFQDKEFREKVCLGAVNSINWARVLAQVTYYFFAYFRVLAQNERAMRKEQQQQQQQQQREGNEGGRGGVSPVTESKATGSGGSGKDGGASDGGEEGGAPATSSGGIPNSGGGGREGGREGHTGSKRSRSLPKMSFSVPTGNFGDALAGYYAKAMGLPIDKILIATNENDILHRFFSNGKYWRREVHPTLSPSMDIAISSNFERLLYHLAGRDPDLLREWMEEFERTGRLTLPPPTLAKAREDFVSCRVDEPVMLETMLSFLREHHYLLCPHSAVGVAAAKGLDMLDAHTICLATAHPGKFLDATLKHLPVEVAEVEEIEEDMPTQLRELDHLPTRSVTLPASAFYVQKYILQTLEGKDNQALLRWLEMAGLIWGYGDGKLGRRRRRWSMAVAVAVVGTAVGVWVGARRAAAGGGRGVLS